MKILNIEVIGESALLQHDDKTANPMNPYTKRLKEITGKRKKTDEDIFQIAKIEWEASLYHTEKDGYFIKAECFEGTFLTAAKAFKLGNVFKQAVSIPKNPKLKFSENHLNPDRLFEITEYRDIRTVKVGMQKVMRCRPIFNEWSCKFELWYDETRIDESTLFQVLQYAGNYIGVCDYRPKFGRFNVKQL